MTYNIWTVTVTTPDDIKVYHYTSRSRANELFTQLAIQLMESSEDLFIDNLGKDRGNAYIGCANKLLAVHLEKAIYGSGRYTIEKELNNIKKYIKEE